MDKGPISYFASNRVAANLLLVFLLVGGLSSAYFLPVQLFPKIDLRQVTIAVPFPGSSSKEIEQDIIRRIEERVIGLRGVERVISSAEQGLGLVRIEMHTFAESNSVLDEVKSAVDNIARFPPAGAESPDIRLINLNFEVMTLAVSSESASEDELRQVVEEMRSELLAQPSISHVEIYGVRDREITVEINAEQLRRHQLTLSRIERRIKQESVNFSFGELRTETGNIILHTISKRLSGEMFEDIPLVTHLDGTIVTLGDVATVRDGFVDHDIRSELNGVPTAFVRINADESQSIVAIAEQVKSWLANKSMPPHITAIIWNDRADLSIQRFNNIVTNGIIGAILVFICLVAVFDLRYAIWITVGIPASFIGAFLFFGVADLGLNIATIFALFLLIGIVVDDAIVVGESIAAERESGKNALEAAISGAKSMFWPITLGGTTTAIAFVPLLFVTSERYQIASVIPYIVFFVLLVSWIEVFLILPGHLSKSRPLGHPPISRLQQYVNARIEMLRNQVIAPAITWSVTRMYLTPIIGLVLVAFAFALLFTDTVPLVLNDRETNTSGNIQAEVSMPPGTPFSITLETAEKIAHAARLADESLGGQNIESVSMVVGLPVMLPRQSIHEAFSLERNSVALRSGLS
ncbi:MAG: efflux RND transporter permease subunit, partial [Acidiferrobacterales bacterium]|nr:efflux RND transporter permease subunit [Acidiferrobacterales bacterium]